MKVLITGGAGYIGSILTHHLLECGHHVTVLDNFQHGENSLATAAWADDIQIVNGDARDNRTVKPLLSKADVVIPLAAIVGASACASDELAAVSTNVSAVRMICEYASPSQWVIIPNTNSGYGIGGEAECTEDSPLRPISLYGRTKCEAEQMVMHRENSASFRLATVFGASPRMRIDLMVNDFVHRALRDRSMVIFEGHFRRNFVHVRDVARAFLHVIDNFAAMKGQSYNVGDTSANMTKIQLCERIKKHIQDFHWVEAETGKDPDKRDYLVSNERMYATGWKPAFTIDDGIVELIKLFQGLKNWRYGNA